MRYKEETLSLGGDEVLAQLVQRSYVCPIPGGAQGRVGWLFPWCGVGSS